MFVYVTRVYNIAAVDFYIGYSYMQSVLGAPDTFSPHPMASRFHIHLTIFCFMQLVFYPFATSHYPSDSEMLRSRHVVITVIPRLTKVMFNSVLFTSLDWGLSISIATVNKTNPRKRVLLAAVKHIPTTLHFYTTAKYCRTQKGV